MSRLRARVVVVGTGAVGLAVALQLRRAGVDGVVVLDRNTSAGMGSTARANGGVRAQFATAVNIAFSQYTIPRLAELDQLTGGKVGYRAVGYLFMAGGDASCAALHRAVALQRALHLPVELVSARRVCELAPMVRAAGLRAAAFCASDGLIDPHGVAGALWSEGAKLGATYLFDTEVVGIERYGSGAIVHCASDEVEAEHVVNAAGARARGIAALAGVNLPVLPYRRNLACTEPLPAIPVSLPMCVDMDTGVLVRREGGGLLVAWLDPETPSSFETAFEPAFLDAVAARAGNRFPLLEQATVNPRKCWAGLYPETPDHNAVIDAPPSAPWFVQCAGFGGHGIMHSLAAGQAVTELVRDQRCSTFDIWPLRLDRFDGPLTAETAVL